MILQHRLLLMKLRKNECRLCILTKIKLHWYRITLHQIRILSLQNTANVFESLPEEHDITNYFEVGQMGIEHALLPEKGLIVAGETLLSEQIHIHVLTERWEHFLQV